jgi:hypothetical protein
LPLHQRSTTWIVFKCSSDVRINAATDWSVGSATGACAKAAGTSQRTARDEECVQRSVHDGYASYVDAKDHATAGSVS